MLPITSTSVRSIIEQTFKFASIPNHTSLKDCGIDYSQLQFLKRKIYQAFKINITLDLNDTVDSIHEKLLV